MAPGATRYIGRFAPSPTGPLHAGSLVAALASWLDARAHSGQWIVRIEDADVPRCSPAAAETILAQLVAVGLVSDAPVVWQSRRTAAYERALQRLAAEGHAYRCRCTRADVERALAAIGRLPERHGERVYPGTCHHLNIAPSERGGWRLRTQAADGSDLQVDWHDRRLGQRHQNLSQEVGDFVLQRSDGLWAYQLAVVVDDEEQQVTDVVRGEDLADNTPRQIHLQRLLGYRTPRYLHAPLVMAADGQKLSKQNGAAPLELGSPLHALQSAALVLGLDPPEVTPQTAVADWLAGAVARWQQRLG